MNASGGTGLTGSGFEIGVPVAVMAMSAVSIVPGFAFFSKDNHSELFLTTCGRRDSVQSLSLFLFLILLHYNLKK
ncbi:hypothetical protein Paes_1874 [Prosthecochloris aestuarii DSM 271]|uniref:Uncharacterized protein n=1 Tax=Prosthecochloris aestuarii (strain DSM 271 / SK 413) TaxID=290512 RepID=B4S4J0_PROA2|nr:hypothetical protein Paes_1874 [Prosthecochloris aestuarii DSM 271]